MAKWTGEPGGGGLFSSFIDQRFEFGNKKFGRWSPVLAPNGAVMLEPGEELITSVSASGIAEVVEHGPTSAEGSTIEWSQVGPMPIGITTRRLFFATDDLPINAVQRRIQKRHGTQHAGHIRWIWTDVVETDADSITLSMAPNPDAGLEVRINSTGRFYRTSLRVGFSSPTTTMTASKLVSIAGGALVDDRLRRSGTSDTAKIRLEEARKVFDSGVAAAVELPGALPHPYMSHEEYDHPDVVAARSEGKAIGALHDIGVPLRVAPLKPAEMRRIKKAFGGWTAGEGDPRQVRRWMYDVDLDFVAGIAANPSVSVEVLKVLREMQNTRINALLAENPSAPDT